METDPHIAAMAATPLTADELLRLNLPDKRTALVKGVLVVREPAGYQHGEVVMNLATAIHTFVRTHRLGSILAAATRSTARTCSPDYRFHSPTSCRTSLAPEPFSV